MDEIQKTLLEQIAGLHEVPNGAYNIRANGSLDSRNTTANIDIVTKENEPGIDIIIKPNTKHESVHIPVVLSQSGLTDMVYNDFYIGENSDVVIVANTSLTKAEVDTYVEIGKAAGAYIAIQWLTGNYQNVHKVPDETLQKMKAKLQEYTAEILLWFCRRMVL